MMEKTGAIRSQWTFISFLFLFLVMERQIASETWNGLLSFKHGAGVDIIVFLYSHDMGNFFDFWWSGMGLCQFLRGARLLSFSLFLFSCAWTT